MVEITLKIGLIDKVMYFWLQSAMPTGVFLGRSWLRISYFGDLFNTVNTVFCILDGNQICVENVESRVYCNNIGDKWKEFSSTPHLLLAKLGWTWVEKCGNILKLGNIKLILDSHVPFIKSDMNRRQY